MSNLSICYIEYYNEELKLSYYVYILECSDETLYTGITTDISRRVDEHNHSSKGAKYTKVRRPTKLLYSKEYKNRSEASQEEYRIKKLSRVQKLKLISKSRLDQK